MPTAPFDDVRRANIVSDIANALLHSYDFVIYSDCDEILVADPIKFASLGDFCAKFHGPCSAGIGSNLVHNIKCESPLEAAEGVLIQRSHVQFVSPMCKPLLIRERVSWGAGFHSANFPLDFSGLFLFHLRWVDLGECLKRLAITRKINFNNPNEGAHQRLSNLEYINIFAGFRSCPSKTMMNSSSKNTSTL